MAAPFSLAKRIYIPSDVQLSLDSLQSLGNYVYGEDTQISQAIEEVTARFNILIPELWQSSAPTAMPSSGTWYRLQVDTFNERLGINKDLYDPVNYQIVVGRQGVLHVNCRLVIFANASGNRTGSALLVLHQDPQATPLVDLLGHDFRYCNFTVGTSLYMEADVIIDQPPQTFYLLCSHTANVSVDAAAVELNLRFYE